MTILVLRQIADSKITSFSSTSFADATTQLVQRGYYKDDKWRLVQKVRELHSVRIHKQPPTFPQLFIASFDKQARWLKF